MTKSRGGYLFKNMMKYKNFGIYKYTLSCRIASMIFLTAYSGSRIGNREGHLGYEKTKHKLTN